MLNPIVVYNMRNPIIDDYGTKIWCNKKGQWHRLDGPAIVYKNGAKCWWKNNTRHRTDGPAIIWSDGRELWFINGEQTKPIPNIICHLRKKLKDE